MSIRVFRQWNTCICKNDYIISLDILVCEYTSVSIDLEKKMKTLKNLNPIFPNYWCKHINDTSCIVLKGKGQLRLLKVFFFIKPTWQTNYFVKSKNVSEQSHFPDNEKNHFQILFKWTVCRNIIHFWFRHVELSKKLLFEMIVYNIV